MSLLANASGCTWGQLSILQNSCFVPDHRVHCPNCPEGKDIWHGLETIKDFRASEIADFTSWIAELAKSSVKFVYGLVIDKLG